MSRPCFRHLSNIAVLRTLDEEVALGRQGTTKVLALITEVEVRRIYADEGYPSLWEFCVKRLGFSEDEAGRRIHASRAARRFPVILDLIADGRLHLSGVKLLKPHLTPATANSLLRASIHKTRDEIRQLLADRFPCPDVPTRVVPLSATPIDPQSSENITQPFPVPEDECLSPVPGPVKMSPNSEVSELEPPSPTLAAWSPQPVQTPAAEGSAPRGVEPNIQRSQVEPLGLERYGLHLTLRKITHDKMRRLEELLGSQVAAGDLDAVLEHAFDVAIAQLEKRKFAKTSRPRTTVARRTSQDPRYVPARVRREVSKRDGERCTFVGDGGKRCDCRRDLEFDHVEPVARGGEATLANLRLRCRAHNQLEAERTFGHAFMNGKREAAVEARGRNAGCSAARGARPLGLSEGARSQDGGGCPR